MTILRRAHILLGMAKIQLWGYRCERCGHEWLPREKAQEPRVCPKCKTPYWNVPRKATVRQGDARLWPHTAYVAAMTEHEHVAVVGGT